MPSIAAPWAIILCKFSNKPTEPSPPAFYRDMFARNGIGGICDYWLAVTSNALDISGSQVFGWFTMTQDSNVAANADRATRYSWGLDAAAANGVDLTTFSRVLVIENDGPDHGAIGIGTGQVLIVHTGPSRFDIAFVAHEMGHGFGLPHSFSANPDTEYGDGWDVMSFDTTTFDFPTTFEGASSLATVGLNARNLDALQGAPSSRVFTLSQPDFSASIKLAPLNQQPIGNDGFLFARVLPGATNPPRSNGSSFTVEYRQKAGWDQHIPGDAVLIHEIRTTGLSFLLPSLGGSFAQGQTFTTPDPPVFIKIANVDTSGQSASVRIWDLPDNALRKEDSDPKVYLLQGGKRRWVTSPAALQAMGKSFSDVLAVPDGALSVLPLGPDIDLEVSVTPFPVPIGHAVSVVVHADVVGHPVNGRVMLHGQIIGPTNSPFTHTFHLEPKVVGSGRHREVEWVPPTGTVEANGFAAKEVRFG